MARGCDTLKEPGAAAAAELLFSWRRCEASKPRRSLGTELCLVT